MDSTSAKRQHGTVPLSRHVIFHSSDVDVIRSRTASWFAPHSLTLAKQQSALEASMHACDIGSIRVAYFKYGAEVILNALQLENRTTLLLPVAGSMRLKQGRTGLDLSSRSAGILRPDVGSVLDFRADVAVLVLAFNHQALHTHLQRLMGVAVDPHLAFDPSIPQRSRASVWHGMTEMLVDFADQASRNPSPLVAEELSRAAMTTLLVSQPHNHTSRMRVAAPAAAPSAVRQIADAIQSDPRAHHDVVELAASAGVSVRSLQNAFQRTFGLTPTAYIREARLNAAHQSLASADSVGSTVSEIAADCGFLHLGRFAAEYRQRFGQLPSATLRTAALNRD